MASDNIPQTCRHWRWGVPVEEPLVVTVAQTLRFSRQRAEACCDIHLHISPWQERLVFDELRCFGDSLLSHEEYLHSPKWRAVNKVPCGRTRPFPAKTTGSRGRMILSCVSTITESKKKNNQKPTHSGWVVSAYALQWDNLCLSPGTKWSLQILPVWEVFSR